MVEPLPESSVPTPEEMQRYDDDTPITARFVMRDGREIETHMSPYAAVTSLNNSDTPWVMIDPVGKPGVIALRSEAIASVHFPGMPWSQVVRLIGGLYQ